MLDLEVSNGYSLIVTFIGMKFVFGLLTGCVFTVLSAVIVLSAFAKKNAAERESRFLELYATDQQYRIYELLDNSAAPLERILTAEGSFVNLYVPEDKRKCYLTYFNRGLDSSGGIVSAKDRWAPSLELAYQRGFQMKQIFTDGFRAGLLQGKSL